MAPVTRVIARGCGGTLVAVAHTERETFSSAAGITASRAFSVRPVSSMNIIRVVIVTLCIMALSAKALPSTPSATAAASASTFSDQIAAGTAYPGSVCHDLAYEEFNKVLTHGTDRVDHFVLAQTYMMLGERGLAC